MKVTISDELRELFKRILNENRTEIEWREFESDDMFQTGQLCGGFDTIEDAFCFSYFSEDGNEYWFQLSLEEVNELVFTGRNEIEMRPAL